VIDNGTIQLGVNDWGNLNVLPPDGGIARGTPSSAPAGRARSRSVSAARCVDAGISLVASTIQRRIVREAGSGCPPASPSYVV
jgi:hypothetical protein